MKEKCDKCGAESDCNFGMHGNNFRKFFCTVECMVEYAKEHGFEPFSGMMNVRKAEKSKDSVVFEGVPEIV